MDYSQPFSVLNEKLKPRLSSSEQLHSSLCRLEEKKVDSLRIKASSYLTALLQDEPDSQISKEDPQEPRTTTKQEGLFGGGPEEGPCSDLLPFINSSFSTDFKLEDEDEEEQANDNSSVTASEETDSASELTSEEGRDSVRSGAEAKVRESPFQRFYADKTLPDLVNSGRPLGRRRTLTHVSDTLKEVRREVELSRRRSIKLKAQVDKLQGSNDGPGWSQHRERVTDEVLSVLRLLHPLLEPESSQPEPKPGENRLDAALVELKNVARQLAISHTKNDSKSWASGVEESPILQQALRDRDDAIEKKKAMEGEVLRSKTELMMLNNQLLEAAQKRLELSLELEAWKDDFQRLLQQQVMNQHLAEQQAQAKSSRKGLLRRNKQPLIQRPANFSHAAPTPPTTNSSGIFVNKSANPSPPTSAMPSPPPASNTRTWRDKLKKSRPRLGQLDGAEQEKEWGRGDDGFQAVSLD
ncbi:bicaudal-D-related protein 2-like [Fundulus heteroclitus]|uniref:bicaudal-D-related protein 2-like n=1 Tax=Fundulus heteroclitus TaxID=8078 RepID=UPI00165AECDE|nr:bicaudal-D-related protein 2-like [Fundulus heteroclitus]